MFILKVLILINNQLLGTINAKYFNTEYYFSDFRNEINGIFVLGGGGVRKVCVVKCVWFFRQISIF